MPAKEVDLMLPRLFAILDQSCPLHLLEALAESGVDGFQVRDKGATTAELVRLTELVLAVVRPHGASVVVNDRVDVALVTGADGVHLGVDDLSVTAARRLAPTLLVGATCRSRADVERAAAAGADYAGFGPLFATTSKERLPAPLGPAALADAVGVLPLIGIGGVQPDNVEATVEAGAHGVAVIGGLWRQPDPLVAAKELVRAVG